MFNVLILHHATTRDIFQAAIYYPIDLKKKVTLYAMSQVNERGRGRMRRIRVAYPRLVGTHCDIFFNRWGNILPPGIYHVLFHGEY